MTASENRRELKYRIPASEALLLEKTLPLVMRRDPHAASDGRYLVRSLYFDDGEKTAFWQKLAGEEKRAKYRLRYYGNSPDHLVFEIKEKIGDICRKRSETVTLEQGSAMEAGAGFDAETPLLREFQALRRTEGLVPSVIVEYERVPFVLTASRTRVTLDLNVRAVPPRAGFLAGRGASLPVLEEGTQILEVKYDDFLPAQVVRILQDIPRDRVAISKYCMCLAALAGQL